MGFFIVLRVIGWLVAALAIYSRFDGYSGEISSWFSKDDMKFHLLGASYLELIYQYVKLYKSVKKENLK